MYILNMFFISSILGHFIENFFYTTKDSGIMYGYWTPVYGIGVVIIILINDFVSKKKLKPIYHAIYVFFISALILSIMEYIGGFLIEILFHKTFWDYSNQALNIGKYTSLSMSIIWGISSIIFLYLLKPLLELIIKKIPKIITYILSIIFIIDFLFTICKSFS